MFADRFDSWRRTIGAAVRLALALALGFAAIVGAGTVAWLTATRPVLAVVALIAVSVLVLRRQGGLAALAAALWHIGTAQGRRAATVNRRRWTGYPEDWR
ncbi:MAG: hypothetical protein ACYDD0_12300 [Candidatus Dormibacteria bacterium]